MHARPLFSRSDPSSETPGGSRGNLHEVERRPTLSLNEWAVLGLLVEKARHGYDIAAALQPGTPLGDAWHLTRQLVYRALERLEALGLAEPQRTESSSAGPRRTVFAPTARGQVILGTWLATPVEHVREIRSVFLLKLLIAEQLGLDSRDLVRAQRRAFADLFARVEVAPPRTDVVATWRHFSVRAVAAYLQALDEHDR
jgi:DNA-binding PadR family transcriptional regulator